VRSKERDDDLIEERPLPIAIRTDAVARRTGHRHAGLPLPRVAAIFFFFRAVPRDIALY